MEEKNLKENPIISAQDLLTDRILTLLLKDKTTGRNILWGTEEYSFLGTGYSQSDERDSSVIDGLASDLLTPRTKKNRKTQASRIHSRAEVFTPAWVCNRQINLIDNDWFGRSPVFNIETDEGWQTEKGKILFPDQKGKQWEDYVKANRLEISCGEAPYLTSRYDAVSGKTIPLSDRIGILDRKLRIVSENTATEKDWNAWSVKAIQSVYGYEWQGDSLLLARENLLCTYIENYQSRFGKNPDIKTIRKIADIITWNVFQMDGIKGVIPNSCHPRQETDTTLFEEDSKVIPCPGCQSGDNSRHNGIYAKTFDWSAKKSVVFYKAFRSKTK